VILPPVATGFGLPLLVTARSQATLTPVVTVVLLLVRFGSVVPVAEIVEVAVIVPAATVGATFTTTIMSAIAPTATLGFVQVTEVVTVQVHPGGADTEENVVFVGIGSAKLTVEAAAGPLFVIVCV
jgi:hypothetical protein